MADGGISDSSVINEVRHEPTGGTSGWASLGRAFGNGGGNPLNAGGAGTQQGETAYENGMRIGAQTVDAMAQAKQRIQANESSAKAADMLESNPQVQDALGLSQPLSNLFATRLRAGDKIEDVMKAATESVHFKNRSKIADANAPENARVAAAASEDPAGLMPKAEGSLGSVFRPAANGGQGATTVSPLQQQSAQSEIDLRGAQAKAAGVNAGAHVVSSDAAAANAGAGGGGKLRTGNKWVADPQDPTGVQHDADGNPVQTADLNANKGEGAVSERNTRRMVIAAQGLAKEANNLSKIGLSESVGAQITGAGHGVFGTASENMGKSFSTDAQQNYKSSIAGMERQLATLELAGGIPPGTYVQQLKTAVANDPSDTPSNRLFHASIFRQIAEVAAESAHASPKMDIQSKNAIYDAVAKVQQAIPFTASEVQDYRRDGKKGQTFQQYLDSVKREPNESFRDGAAAAAPQADHAAPVGAAPTQADPLGILGK